MLWHSNSIGFPIQHELFNLGANLGSPQDTTPGRSSSRFQAKPICLRFRRTRPCVQATDSAQFFWDQQITNCEHLKISKVQKAVCDGRKNNIWNTRALWKCHDAPDIVIIAGVVYRRKTWGIWGWTLATCNNSSKVGIILCAPESIPNTNALVEGRKCSKPRFLQPNWWGVLQVFASTIHIIHQVRTRSLRSPVWHVQNL